MGKFISFEGGDATGKSTQVRRLKHWLEGRGVKVVCTAEPDGSRAGKAVRALMDSPAAHKLGTPMQALLFMGARRLHMERIIRPALARGHWVLCDRFCDSSFVYQSAGKDGMRLGDLQAWHATLCDGFFPDATILLTLDMPQLLARLARRGAVRGFDARKRAWHQDIARRYARLARIYDTRFIRVDAGQSVAQTADEIAQTLAQRFMV